MAATSQSPSDVTGSTELPAVLRGAAAEVIAEAGLDGFSLREVARRAGVSHAAPGYHFGDARGLLTSLAVEGLEVLHRETSAAASGIEDPIERLIAIGRAYVRVGIDHPAHCEVVFREDVIDPDRQAYQEAGLLAYGVLEDAIQKLAEARDPDMAVDDASKLCWSAMQGLVLLHPKMARMDELAGRPPSSTEELVERFTMLMVDGMIAGGVAP